MDSTATSDEKRMWIDFIKEIKNSQFNKLNSSSIKIGTIVAFMATSIIFIVNTLPSFKPSAIKVYYLLIILNFFMGTIIILFNFFNAFFRKDALKSNMMEIYSRVKKQYMLPVIVASMIQMIIWIAMNITIIILFFLLRYQDLYLFIPSIVYFVVAIGMINFSVKSININYGQMDQAINSRKNYVFAFFNFISLFLIGYYLIAFYSSGFIFSNKIIFIYALYFIGLIVALYYFARYLSYKIIYSWIDRIYIDAYSGNTDINNLREKIINEIKSLNDLDTISYYNNEID